MYREVLELKQEVLLKNTTRNLEVYREALELKQEVQLSTIQNLEMYREVLEEVLKQRVDHNVTLVITAQVAEVLKELFLLEVVQEVEDKIDITL